MNLIEKTPAECLLTTLLLYKKTKHTFLLLTFHFEMNRIKKKTKKKLALTTEYKKFNNHLPGPGINWAR